MKRKEFIQYLLDMKFEKTSKNVWSKTYDKGLRIEYKLNDVMVKGYYCTFNHRVLRQKGRFKNLKINEDKTLSGFTLIELQK